MSDHGSAPMQSEEVNGLALRAELYGLFSAAFRDPDPIYPDAERFKALWSLFPVPGDFPPFKKIAPEDSETEFRRLFGFNLSPDCPPYETHYEAAGIFRKTQTLADLAGFYRAFGVDLAPGDRRSDHLPVELEFLSLLLHKQARAAARGDDAKAVIARHARVKFLGEHLTVWMPSFASAVIGKGTQGCYELLVRRLAAFIAFDALSLGIDLKVSTTTPGDAGIDEGIDEGCASCAGGENACA